MLQIMWRYLFSKYIEYFDEFGTLYFMPAWINVLLKYFKLLTR